MAVQPTGVDPQAKGELKAEAAEAKAAAQRQEQDKAAEQEAAEDETSGGEQPSKRAMRRARGALKRGDEAQKLAVNKAEAIRSGGPSASGFTPVVLTRCRTAISLPMRLVIQNPRHSATSTTLTATSSRGAFRA